MTWHVTSQVLTRYSQSEIDAPTALSVEAHLLACEVCRANIALACEWDVLERLWTEIEVTVMAPRPSPAERVLRWIGIRDHTARLLAATPSLRRSWLLALSAVVAFAVAAARTADFGYALFLLLAPMLPLAGVAGAYGPGVDPTYEIGLASPMKGFHVLLVRASAVLVTTTVVVAVGAILLPGLSWSVIAWLLPSMGLVLSSLALSTLVQPLKAAVWVAVLWLVAAGTWVLASSAPAGARSAFGAPMQTGFVLISLIAGAVLVARRDVWG
ncbi:MAG: zf-HC2 domain-containing protein, partial [Actinomycetota bacterium]|nr:zf-HC2 domain-containing protein [Actinomycetota bacterium]